MSTLLSRIDEMLDLLLVDPNLIIAGPLDLYEKAFPSSESVHRRVGSNAQSVWKLRRLVRGSNLLPILSQQFLAVCFQSIM